MTYALTGILHGRTIELDQVEEALEGVRLRLVAEPLEQAEVRLSKEENARRLKEWAASGPQGPLDGDRAEPGASHPASTEAPFVPAAHV
jgi:hypothetical protein